MQAKQNPFCPNNTEVKNKSIYKNKDAMTKTMLLLSFMQPEMHEKYFCSHTGLLVYLVMLTTRLLLFCCKLGAFECDGSR